VFGDVKADTSDEVKRNWEALKHEERKKKEGSEEAGAKSEKRSIFAGVSSKMPALLEAQKLSSRAAQVGFDWPDVEGLFDKLHEETEELREHLKDHNLDFTTIPYVLQLNKRDLPNVLPVAELQKHLGVKGEPSVEAVAVTGQGVFDTLKEVAKLVLADLKKNA